MGQSFRVGLRVSDVPEAITFFGGLGFEVEGVVPNPDDHPVLAILRRGEANLVLDALVGLPFPDTPRERQIQSGPRGLGVVFGLEVEDLDAAYAYCRAAGCEITCEPMDEAWGERLFTCLDPFGYEWEFFLPITEMEPGNGTAATRASWFGEES
jgi:uncharacterized glyoxalase superfamily protein PhnB